MNDLKELKCPHCRKNIEITDYFRSEINNSKDQIEKKLKEKADDKNCDMKKINDETSLKNEEIENLNSNS